MEIWKSIAGMVEAELVSARLEDTLRLLNEKGIALYYYQQSDPLTGHFWIRRKDWPLLSKLCEAEEGKVRMLSRKGIYWAIKQLRKRPLLVAGAVFLTAFFLYLPSRILFVQVEGCETVPVKQVIAAAEDCGIRFGASRRAVRSEKVKNALLSALPQLQWAGVNTSGCVATISVRERAEQMQIKEPVGVSSMVATRDGYILSATATRGNLLVQPGQTVTEGQLLISGYTDCGISIRAEQAQGEVYAQTNRFLRVISPTDWVYTSQTGEQRKKISLLLGKKRIILWKDSGISVDSCGRMYEEYYITLPGGFQLPAAICIERYPAYGEMSLDLQEAELTERLSDFSKQYTAGQMAGGKILHAGFQTKQSENVFALYGTFICQEMICRVLQEQIGESNGENS